MLLIKLTRHSRLKRIAEACQLQHGYCGQRILYPGDIGYKIRNVHCSNKEILTDTFGCLDKCRVTDNKTQLYPQFIPAEADSIKDSSKNEII